MPDPVIALQPRQLTGIDQDHVQAGPEGCLLHPLARAAFNELRADALTAGFDLRIASGFRSFERQLAIWNAKAGGRRAVHGDDGRPIDMSNLAEIDRVHAILRYSALPGGSRHHWGSDIDVYDAAAVPVDYQVQLSPEEVAPVGVFGPLHSWLDGRLRATDTGFYRP